MPPTAKQQTGKLGEDLAARFLEHHGYTIVARNYYIKGGEVDIIARDANALVFVEVKAARSSSFGDPQEWVDERKQKRIAAAADHYLAQHEIEDLDCRFDIITIDFALQPAVITHIPDAFWLDE